MRSIAGTALVSLAISSTSSPVHAKPISLADAFALVERSPAIAIGLADVEESVGNLDQAGRYNYNPLLRSAGGPVWGPTTVFDLEAAITQGFELGGKRSARIHVARAERAAREATLVATGINLRADIRRAFDLALVAQARIVVTTDNEIAARALRDAAAERLRVGAATQTELNVAVAGIGRAIVAKRNAERDLLVARQALAGVLGLANTELDPTGPVPKFLAAPTDEDRFVADALALRRDLTAANNILQAREANVELADALGVPDPHLSIGWARSALDQSNALVIGIEFPIPLWNRNQGGRAAARAAKKRASVEYQALRAAVERDTRVAFRRYRLAVQAVAAFDQQVVGTLAENLKLARETLAAGKLGLLDVNNVRRDLVDSQLSYLDSIAEAVDARAALERAIGRTLEVVP